MKKPLPYIDRLTPEKVQQVIDDVLLMERGVKIFYAIDPHEVFDFCFPIDPTSADRKPIDAIADDQAALYEVFFQREQKPVLVKDYEVEIRGLIAYFDYLGDEMYGAAEMVAQLMADGELDQLIDSVGTRGNKVLGGFNTFRRQSRTQKLIGLLEDKFSIVLAVAMGIYSLGIERFRKICATLLMTDVTRQGDTLELGNVDTNVRRVRLVFNEIIRNLQIAGIEIDDRKERTAFNDARAIDRLLSANSKIVGSAYRRGNEYPNKLILYLSNASRTEKIFDYLKAHDYLPTVMREPFDFHRDRAQLFTYVVHKSSTGDHEETIARLNDFKDTLYGLQRFTNLNELCSQCVLDGHVPHSCELRSICASVDKLNKQISQRRHEVRNLGLLNTLGEYHELLEATPKGQPQKKFMQFFRELCETGLQDLANNRMLEKQQLHFVQSMMPDNWTRARSSVQNKDFLRHGRDPVMGTIQYLPLNPIVRNEKYRVIIELILSFYKTPPQGGGDKSEIIDRAYKLYFELDINVSTLQAEHEIVRCLLHLAFPTNEGDERAYKHARQMLERSDVLKEVGYSEREYLYILAWAARRLRKYEKAWDVASKAIKRFADDSRFYHARAIVTFSWLLDPAARSSCPHKMRSAIEDAKLAITLLQRKSPDFPAGLGATYEELIGANRNNIAYLAAWEARELRLARRHQEADKSIQEALREINSLKKEVTEWLPMFPEYCHTEAYVRFEDYSIAKLHKVAQTTLLNKLKSAESAINRAINAYASDSYIELRESIKKALFEESAKLTVKDGEGLLPN